MAARDDRCSNFPIVRAARYCPITGEHQRERSRRVCRHITFAVDRIPATSGRMAPAPNELSADPKALHVAALIATRALSPR